jgi:hypothetical protein
MDGDFHARYVTFYFFMQHACNLPMLDLKRVRIMTIMFRVFLGFNTDSK